MERKYLQNFISELFIKSIVLFLFLIPIYCLAANPNAIESTAHEIYSTVMSPFCPALTLKDCPSSKAADLKDDIKKRLEKGETKDEILQSLFKQYGERLNALPPTTGVASLAWVFPILFVLVGGVLVTRWLISHSGKESLEK